MTLWLKLRHDVELKKQLVTVALVATAITVLECVLFFKIVHPQVTNQMQWMLHRDSPIMNTDPMVQSLLRCLMGVAQEREDELVQRTNIGAKVHAGMIATLPLLFVLMLWSCSAPLRRARWKPIFVDVAVTVACIFAFQIAFLLLRNRAYFG